MPRRGDPIVLAMIYVLGFLLAWLRRRAWQRETDRRADEARREAQQRYANELFERNTPNL
jgi:flagellar biosynthesis/type III secretory pathway M-ring protein FliF/YscJ